MTGMTKDYAIAILRHMQEPDPFEPQITEAAFDALEMAIQAIQKYSTWSQTYSNMVEDASYAKRTTESSQNVPNDDLISRKAAIDVLEVFTQKDALGHTPAQIVKALPSAQPEIIYCRDCVFYEGENPCGIVDWWNEASDYCSKGMRREDETD